MAKLPALGDLIASYPAGTPESVATLIGGTVKSNYFDPKYTAYKDTCAIRVSRALNYAGDPIPAAGGGLSNPYMDDKKIRTDKGADGKWYIYSTYDLRAYFLGRYGKPTKVFPGTATKADLAKTTGLVAFGFWHFDIWDGTKCAGHDGGFGNAKVKEILVWETS
jgi:hypothetical protein